MIPSNQSIIAVRERYADLLREAERERRLSVLGCPSGRRPSFIAQGRSLWRQGIDRLRAGAHSGRLPLEPAAD